MLDTENIFTMHAGDVAPEISSWIDFQEAEAATAYFGENKPIRHLNFAIETSGGEQISAFTATKVGPIFEIDIAIVDKPENRKQGIGAAMFQYATQWARKNDCTQVSLWCGRFQDQAAWQTLGFKDYGKIEGIPEANQNILYMGRPVGNELRKKTGNKRNLIFVDTGNEGYKRALKPMQEHEARALANIRSQDVKTRQLWKETPIAFTLTKGVAENKHIFAAVSGFRLYNGLYIDKLAFAPKIDAKVRQEFLEHTIAECKNAKMANIRMNAFPWHGPDNFRAAGMESAGVLTASYRSYRVGRMINKLLPAKARPVRESFYLRLQQ